MTPSLSSRRALAVLAAAFVASRIAYYLMGVRFYAAPLDFYLQYVDPDLLRRAFWESIFYLKEQPPGYNFALGAILQLFPEHFDRVFHGVHLVLGFAMQCALYALLVRIGTPPGLALAQAVAYTVNPVALLYENWLFYPYAITALLTFAALFLHRFASLGRASDGSAFFMCLALLGTVRTLYHPVWFALIALFLLWSLKPFRRVAVRSMMPAALLLAAIYLKHFIVFGGFVIGGDVFQPANLALITVKGLPPGALEKLEASGKISPILGRNIYERTPLAYWDLIPPPRQTGIAILDRPVKSTGFANWNSLWMRRIGAQYRKDALAALREYPEVYRSHVVESVSLYLRGTHWEWPFDGSVHANSLLLAEPLRVSSAITTGTTERLGTPWLSLLWIPGLLVLGIANAWKRVSRWRRDPTEALDPTAVTILFAVFNIIYAGAATILFSDADHNRYRNEVSGLFAVLLGLALGALVTWLKARDPGWRGSTRRVR